jgi:pimeloyl-ACP methyl ester carboxylesterase
VDNFPNLSNAPGEWITVEGTRFHFQRFLRDENAPTILFETGLTMMSACWGWLAPAVSAFANVITYDRAGLGWTAQRPPPRNIQTLAREAHLFLRALNVTGPIFLLGHSMGALVNRAFFKLFPEQVRGMIWLDPSHPKQLADNREMARRMKRYFFWLEAAQFLARKSIPGFELPLLHQIHGLPTDQFKIARHFLRNPGHLRTSAFEARAWNDSAKYLANQTFDNLPLLTISAQKNALPGWSNLQSELASLSTDSTHLTFTEASHVSLLCNKAHSDHCATTVKNFCLKHF